MQGARNELAARFRPRAGRGALALCGRIDPASGLCEGCARTLDEIADWLILDAAERLAVWDRICTRFEVPLARALADKVGEPHARELLEWRAAQAVRAPAGDRDTRAEAVCAGGGGCGEAR